MPKSSLVLVLLLTSSTLVAADPVPRIPVIDADWWRLTEAPELGELNGPVPRRQHVVDHGFVRGTDGKWRLWACLRGTKVGRLLYGWEGESLEMGPWTPLGIVARAEAKFGEKTEPEESIQAPHFVKIGDVFHCFYNSNGIRLMTSKDGKTFTRVTDYDGGNLLYPDGGRDVMVLPVGDRYYAYSTVSTLDRKGFVVLRTSTDLKEWTPRKIVCRGGKAGDGPVSAESPFVVHLEGYFYLFRASSTDFKTYVYRSKDPESFGIDDDTNLITVLPIKAPEVLLHDGKWYISDLADFQGVKLARLKWETAK